MNLNIQYDCDAKPFLMDLEIQHYPVKTQQVETDKVTLKLIWKCERH